jgi:hypothetical protein
MKRALLVQYWILFGILLADFAAQVVYYFHIYYTPRRPFPDLKSTVVMGAVFALFIVSYWLLTSRHKAGYPAMLFYLALEFLFYLWNFIGGIIHRLGWFYHLNERDPVLWVVFAIGYLSFFASGYFLALLIYKRRVLV